MSVSQLGLYVCGNSYLKTNTMRYVSEIVYRIPQVLLFDTFVRSYITQTTISVVRYYVKYRVVRNRIPHQLKSGSAVITHDSRLPK